MIPDACSRPRSLAPKPLKSKCHNGATLINLYFGPLVQSISLLALLSVYLRSTVWTPSNAWTLLCALLGRCLDASSNTTSVLGLYCKAEVDAVNFCFPKGERRPGRPPPPGPPRQPRRERGHHLQLNFCVFIFHPTKFRSFYLSDAKIFIFRTSELLDLDPCGGEFMRVQARKDVQLRLVGHRSPERPDSRRQDRRSVR